MFREISELSSLLETLTVSVEVFKAELVRQGIPEPSLCTSKLHPMDDPSYLSPPVMYEAQRTAIGCLDRLKLLLENTSEVVARTSLSSIEAPGLSIAIEIGLYEILQKASNPEEGEKISVIAQTTNTDPLKLEHVLRGLVTHGWFRETKPGYFANSRRSHTLRKGSQGYNFSKNMGPLTYNTLGKLPAVMTHPDETFRLSRDPNKAAWNILMSSDLPLLGAGGWLDTHPEDAKNFAVGISGIAVASEKGVAQDIPWRTLVNGVDAVVDVGGGQGALCYSLAATYPGIKSFIVQDLPSLKEVVDHTIASKGLSDRVKFQGQDFFEPNCLQGTGSYVFVLQNILHSWSEEDSAKILSNIKECLKDGKSKLLIIDSLVYPMTVSNDGPSVKESLEMLRGKTDYSPIPPPPFIPQDFGDNRMVSHGLNATLIGLCNSFVYTYADMERAAELAGMKIKSVSATRGRSHVLEIGLDW